MNQINRFLEGLLDRKDVAHFDVVRGNVDPEDMPVQPGSDLILAGAVWVLALQARHKTGTDESKVGVA